MNSKAVFEKAKSGNENIIASQMCHSRPNQVGNDITDKVSFHIPARRPE
jgi:hypothetical protein